MNTKNVINQREISFINITKENIGKCKTLHKVYSKYKIQTLRNHGEIPGNRKMFVNLFNCIIGRASNIIVSDNPNHFIAMQSNDRLIGFASIATSTNDVINIPFSYGVIRDFYISPKFRRKGYGRILNDYIEKVFSLNKTNVVLLSPDPLSGIDFWKAMGYCDTGIHQGWGRYLVYVKHIIKNENSLEFDKAVGNIVTRTDLIGINPYNKTQIKEAACVWNEYCIENNRKFHRSNIKKMAFNARKYKAVSFKALYFEEKIIGLFYCGEEIIRYILPKYRNRGFEKDFKSQPQNPKKIHFVKLKKTEDQFKTFSALMIPYCKELDRNVGRKTPEQTLINFAQSILNMSDDKDRFIELCYDSDEPIGFIYGKIDRENHRGYIRPGWGYVMEFYVKPKYRRNGYGAAMYNRLEFLFVSNGVKNIWLTADPVTGKPFWNSVGFKNSGEKSPENNLDIYEKIIYEGKNENNQI